MKAAVAIFLLFAAVFFAWFDLLLAGMICLAIGIYIMVSSPAKSFGSELMAELEEAEGQVPDKGVWEEGLKAAGGILGEQTFSDNEDGARIKAINVTKYKFKPRKVGEASRKTGSLLKRLFG